MRCHTTKNISSIILPILLSLGFTNTALCNEFAQEEEIGELFDFLQVSTASRRQQLITDSPVAIDVITHDEILASGATEVWDLLRFRVGMDVLDARAGDGNRSIVSVRGFPREYVNNLQVLVDGRSVFSGYSGGVYWPQLPVQIQDIDHIEIVRGPSAALYGSNAGLGVIQIFTKKPQQQALSVEAHLGEPKAQRGMFATEYMSDDGASGLRVSYSRKNDDIMVTADNHSGDDSIESHKANLRAFTNLNNDTALELFTGGSWENNSVPRNNLGHFRNVFAMSKISHALDLTSSLELKAAYTESRHRLEPVGATINWGTLEYNQWDLSVVHQKTWQDDLVYSTWGIDYVRMEADSDTLFEGKPAQENENWRLFTHQTYRYSPTLSIIAALSAENSDTGGSQNAYQLTGLKNLNKEHSLRFSYSYSPTIPSIYRQQVNHLPSSFGKVIGNPDLEPEDITSYEISYLGHLNDGKLLIESNLFYMRIDGVNASETRANPNAPPPFLISFTNENRATAKGLEASARYRYNQGQSVYINYTYEELEDDLNDIMVVQATPKHKANLGAINKYGLYTLSFNLGYKDHYTTIPANRSSSFIRDIPSQYRLDIRLAYQINPQWEVAIVGQNLNDPNHIEYSDYDNLETARRYYASLRGNF